MMTRTILGAGLATGLQSVLMSTAFAAAQIVIVNGDGANEGFNDTSPVAPVAGNPGTTLGDQRMNAFRAAADVWEAVLDSPIPITVDAAMDPLSPCTASAGVLGQAGTNAVFRDFPNAPLANTWYPGALANALAGSDQDPEASDIGSAFNSDVDDDPGCLSGVTWWYGINAPAPANTISFLDTVLHEIGHGLGVQTFVTLASGAKLISRDDVYMTFLEDHSSGTGWPAMSNGQRSASANDTGDLHWTGPAVNACAPHVLTGGLASGHVRMYAPDPLELGSSVSHWDTALAPDELMEPFATPTSDQRLTDRLLEDIGWTITSPPCPPVHNPVLSHDPILSHNPLLSGHHPRLSGHHPVLSGHHPRLSGHHPVLSGHHPLLSGHHPLLSGHHPLLSGHDPRFSGHDPRLSGHNPILSGHDPRLSGHDILSSQGHDLRASRGHAQVLSQGHDPSASQGHDPLFSQGHDPLASRGGGHGPIMSQRQWSPQSMPDPMYPYPYAYPYYPYLYP